MKTLNDYIKESILDDEDVFINKIKEESNNPFIVIGNLIASSNDLPKDTTAQQYIKNVVEKDIFKYLPNIFKNPQHVLIQYFKDTISIKWNSNSDIEFLKIRGGYQDYNAIVYFLDSFYAESFGFKNDTQYEKWVKEFMKRFDLKPTQHDMFIGTI